MSGHTEMSHEWLSAHTCCGKSMGFTKKPTMISDSLIFTVKDKLKH